MLIKTHLAITILGILLILPNLSSKIVFVIIALLATYIPDIDSRYSSLGQRRFARVLQFFSKHRGIIHSFSFLLFITLLLVLFLPKIALGFFLGYGLHLFADSFTLEGIVPFYPIKAVSRGVIVTGGVIEKGVFISFVLIDSALFLNYLLNVI